MRQRTGVVQDIKKQRVPCVQDHSIAFAAALLRRCIFLIRFRRLIIFNFSAPQACHMNE
jgi:hypothetical protein